MINKINNIFSNYDPYINGWENYKRAAVTIPLIVYKGSIHILFEVRSKNLRTNPNEICFPGGKIEDSEIPVETAIRETCEEIGICHEKITVISQLDLFISPFNTLIHPFLVEIKNLDNVNINGDEVEKIFLVPLDYFLTHKPKVFVNTVYINPRDDFPYDLIPNKRNYKFKTGSYETIFYTYDEYVIWGITAKILQNFLNTLTQKNYQI